MTGNQNEGGVSRRKLLTGAACAAVAAGVGAAGYFVGGPNRVFEELGQEGHRHWDRRHGPPAECCDDEGW